MAGSTRLWPSLFAGTSDEYLRLAGCTQVYNPVGFADFLVNLSFRGLPLHEPDHLMAWTEIGEFADRALYQCSCLLPARAAEPFRNEKWYRVVGISILYSMLQRSGKTKAITPTEKATTQCGFRFFWYAQHSSSHGRLVRPLLMTMT